MRGRLRGRSKDVAAIDMGPMIDMVFLLLIFTLVTARMTEDSVVELDPPASTQAESRQDNAVHISVDRRGDIYVNNEIAGHFAQAAIAQQLAQKGSDHIVLHADGQTSTADLMHAMDVSREAGALHVDLAATAK
ncbi:biopolymer transporter ExbD [Pontiellaceae bacterium B1224]|nr:biopolymer transporter ExbD [Pontiellaceae bacterium B1224]